MKVAFYTLGCRLNRAETEKLIKDFNSAGFNVVSFLEKADFYIINTCSVTSLADKKLRTVIKGTKRKNLRAKIVILGCGVSSKILKNINYDLAIPNEKKTQALKIFEQRFCSKRTRDISKQLIQKNVSKKLIHSLLHTRAFIKIQDGCNDFCIYCIVPYLRGREVSYRRTDIISEIKQREKEGYKEVVLTGVNIGKYKWKVEGEKSKVKVDLADLIEGILNETDILRIKLSSINPQDVTDKLIKLWVDNSRLCRQFHLSLQSGSDSVLKRMNRKYSTKDYTKVVKKIRKAMPGFCLTTDIIVGFPGETEKEFKETHDFIEKIGFAKVHVFRYSKRAGTEAADMPNQILEDIKKDRGEELRELSSKLEKKYQKKFIGRESKVLFEEKKGNYWTGLTDNYLRVKIKDDKNLKNRIVKVRLKRIKGRYLIGEKFS